MPLTPRYQAIVTGCFAPKYNALACRLAQSASQPADSSPCTEQGYLASFHREGITILLVEQNVNSTLEITDKAYVLETGRITLQGRGRDLLKNSHIKKAYLGL